MLENESYSRATSTSTSENCRRRPLHEGQIARTIECRRRSRRSDSTIWGSSVQVLRLGWMMAMSIITRAVSGNTVHPAPRESVAAIGRELADCKRIQVTLTESIDAADCKHVFRQRIRAVDTVLRLGAQFRSDGTSTPDVVASRPRCRGRRATPPPPRLGAKQCALHIPSTESSHICLRWLQSPITSLPI